MYAFQLFPGVARRLAEVSLGFARAIVEFLRPGATGRRSRDATVPAARFRGPGVRALLDGVGLTFVVGDGLVDG